MASYSRGRVVSPGVFTREIDLSFYPKALEAIGAAVIGPTVRGPVFVPTPIASYSEYVRFFGDVFSSGSGDSLRQYKYLTSYAVQEYLRWGQVMTITRVLPNNYAEAYSYVISSGSYAVGGSGSANSSFKLYAISEGDIFNSGREIASDNGYGSTLDEYTSGSGALISGSRYNIRWEVDSVDPVRGTFNLYIRRGDDTTNRRIIYEQYNELSLDPNTPNYIANVIGDQKRTLRYDSDLTPYLQLSGSYPNRSRLVRVEVLKTTDNYLDQNGNVRDGSLSGSLPAPVSGTFAYGDEGNIAHPKAMYESIYNNNTQGFNLAVDANGKTAYEDAIDILSNADEYDINLLVMPGVINNAGNAHAQIITKAINMCEDRGDVFFIIDPTTFASTVGQAQIAAESRNTNYGAMYFPWIQIPDPDLSRNVWVPPSSVLTGVYAFNDYVKFPWFAPAGLNRGGIDIAVQPERKLTLADRDALYVKSMNPIAQFPREGVVVWGQKTLQKKQSALDRVNVRRLLIHAKKHIAAMSRYLVFEQNDERTWDKFKAMVNPYLESIRNKQGLYDFRVIMDAGNNPPDVIDRNELIGQLYLKPTKVAEFIKLDFIVLPTGAAFPGE